MSLFDRINTPSSLFGRTNTQPQQTPSIFAPASATPSTGGGLFGGASSNNQAPPTSPAPSAPSGGFFGTPQTPAVSTGGSLFSPAVSTTPAGGGLFGATPATATSAAGGGGGLFGGTSAAPASNTGGLFGTGMSTSAVGGGLLGGAAAAPATGGGLFSGTLLQKPQTPLLFTNTAPKPSLFTVSTPTGQQQQQQGQQQQQQQQNTVPAATIDITRLTATTRFGDCHEGVQQELEQLEKHIQDQIRAAQELDALFPNHRTVIDSIPTDTKVLAHKLSTTKSFLSADQSTLQSAQQHHTADNEAATLSIRCLDLFRLPPAQRSQYFQRSEQQRGENEVTSNGPMITYFNNHAATMDKKFRIFLESVGEVEASLRSVEQQAAIGGSGAGVNGEDLTAITGGIGGRQDARRLNRTLREFNDALKDVSGRIVDVKDGLRELKAGGKR